MANSMVKNKTKNIVEQDPEIARMTALIEAAEQEYAINKAILQAAIDEKGRQAVAQRELSYQITDNVYTHGPYLEKRHLFIGAIVTVRGYAGRAEIINMEEDGVTPQGHPKYLCTVRFNVYTRGSKPIDQFYAGRLLNIMLDVDDEGNIEPDQLVNQAEINHMTAEELIQRYRELTIQECEL